MQPIVHGLEEQFLDEVAFISVNASTPDGLDVFSSYSLFGHPAFLILNEDGEILWQSVGEQPEPVIRDAIEKILEK